MSTIFFLFLKNKTCRINFSIWSESIFGLAKHSKTWTFSLLIWANMGDYTYPVLFFLYHWLEFNENITESLLHFPLCTSYSIIWSKSQLRFKSAWYQIGQWGYQVSEQCSRFSSMEVSIDEMPMYQFYITSFICPL